MKCHYQISFIYDKIRYFANERPWKVACDVALPCATQNEIEEHDADLLAANGCKWVFEGANMPSTNKAIEIYKKNNIFYFPAKVVLQLVVNRSFIF